MVTKKATPPDADRRVWRLHTTTNHPRRENSYVLTDNGMFDWKEGECFNAVSTKLATQWLRISKNMSGRIPKDASRVSHVQGKWAAECVGVFWDLGDDDQ